MLASEGDKLKRVVVCTPRKEYAGGASDLEKHNIGDLGEPETAVQQHDDLKSELAKFGAQVTDVPELEGHPNSVFVRDTALSTPQGYVKLRLGLDSRLGEGDWMAGVLNGLGEPCVGEIKAPGKVDGGDVVLAGDVAFVGRSIRTNEEGIRQLSVLLKGM
jgi:dimethylargininase